MSTDEEEGHNHRFLSESWETADGGKKNGAKADQFKPRHMRAWLLLWFGHHCRSGETAASFPVFKHLGNYTGSQLH